MSKGLDELSKDLASGMSRRKALWRFFAGAGAALGAGLLGGKRVQAQGNNTCVVICKAIAQLQFFSNQPPNFVGECVSASAHCPPGECAEPIFVNGGGGPVVSGWVCFTPYGG